MGVERLALLKPRLSQEFLNVSRIRLIEEATIAPSHNPVENGYFFVVTRFKTQCRSNLDEPHFP